MKKLLNTLLSALAAGLLFTHTALAFDGKGFAYPGVDAVLIPIQPQESAPAAIDETDGADRAARAPAPYLTYLQVYAVYSNNCGWEYPSPSTTMTSCDHGGATLVVVTLELGYGNLPIATMNGGQLASSANYRTDSVCRDVYGNLVYCSAGQTVVGFLKYWNVSGYQNGYFTYRNTSTNSPWNTMSDAMSIR